MAAHAKLGPSSAERWFNCPGSIKASAGIPNTSGVFAAEGTAAHALAAYCLEHGFDAARFLGAVAGPDGVNDDVAAEADDETTFEVTDEMADAVQTYLDLCRQFMSPPWEYEIEQRLDLTSVHKDVFGTGDFLAYNPETKNLVVVDYKHGKGHAVTVEQNKQLLTYGLGAALRHHNRGIDAIDLYIVQPRCPHPEGPVREAKYDTTDLLEFQIDLADAAKATEAENAPLVAGEWCKFCPAAAVCPTLREKATALAEAEFAMGEVSGLSGDKLAEILNQASLLKDWIKRVEAYAQQEAQHGRLPTGYKLVAKRATRKWRNADEARQYLSSVLELDDEQIFAEPKMKSPAQIESLIGKKRAKKELDGLWEAVSSGANLVPEDDARPALKSTAEEEFA
jgi:hypothetical protein